MSNALLTSLQWTQWASWGYYQEAPLSCGMNSEAVGSNMLSGDFHLGIAVQVSGRADKLSTRQDSLTPAPSESPDGGARQSGAVGSS